jgi:hypothetical protein
VDPDPNAVVGADHGAAAEATGKRPASGRLCIAPDVLGARPRPRRDSRRPEGPARGYRLTGEDQTDRERREDGDELD